MPWWGWVLTWVVVVVPVAALTMGKAIALRDRPDDPRWR